MLQSKRVSLLLFFGHETPAQLCLRLAAYAWNGINPWVNLALQLASRFGISSDHAVTSVIYLLNGLTSRQAEILQSGHWRSWREHWISHGHLLTTRGWAAARHESSRTGQ